MTLSSARYEVEKRLGKLSNYVCSTTNDPSAGHRAGLRHHGLLDARHAMAGNGRSWRRVTDPRVENGPRHLVNLLRCRERDKINFEKSLRYLPS